MSREHVRFSRGFRGTFRLSRPKKRTPDMRTNRSVFSQLLQPIDRRAFAAIVARHDGDAYDKKFKSWDHLVALIFAQTRGLCSLRSLESDFNANSGAHYHLGAGALKRATLSE